MVLKTKQLVATSGGGLFGAKKDQSPAPTGGLFGSTTTSQDAKPANDTATSSELKPAINMFGSSSTTADNKLGAGALWF